MDRITTLSTSSRTSAVNDLILRETDTTRLIFRPLIIDNARNQQASVKGWLIFQKKGPTDDWRDYKTLDLNQLKKGEWVKLELKAEEILKLLERSSQYRQIYKKYGITYGTADFIVTHENIGNIFSQIAHFPDRGLLQALQSLDTTGAQKLGSLVGISQLDKALGIWRNNKENSDEGFWRNTFKTYSWIISQIFACPYVFIGNEYYFGGKKGNNKGGVYGDFLYKNKLTGNVAFIEIKTPTTELIGKRYRGEKDTDNNTVYSASPEMSGGINQVLNQRATFQRNQVSLEEGDKNILNSKCILIIGNTNDLTAGKKKSFDLYRNNLKDVEIVAFDELFERIENLKNLFTQ